MFVSGYPKPHDTIWFSTWAILVNVSNPSDGVRPSYVKDQRDFETCMACVPS